MSHFLHTLSRNSGRRCMTYRVVVRISQGIRLEQWRGSLDQRSSHVAFCSQLSTNSGRRYMICGSESRRKWAENLISEEVRV